jgi:ABC-type transporter Mla MlaB component
MKQAKRKNAAVLDVATDAAPDAAYVEQLLAAANTDPVQSGTISLPAQCLLRDAVDLKQQLLSYPDSAYVEIDVAAVERVDTAYMQVLLAFVHSRAAGAAAINWLNVNAIFVEAATLLGLRSTLQLPDLSAAV